MFCWHVQNVGSQPSRISSWVTSTWGGMFLWVWAGKGRQFCLFVYFNFHGAPQFCMTCDSRQLRGRKKGQGKKDLQWLSVSRALRRHQPRGGGAGDLMKGGHWMWAVGRRQGHAFDKKVWKEFLDLVYLQAVSELAGWQVRLLLESKGCWFVGHMS